MIKIDNLKVYGIEEAIRGMRNPKNSWNKSDSYISIVPGHSPELVVGDNDSTLMTNLSKGGPVHAKYRRYIDVYVDITAPLYFWKEFDTYRVGVCPNPSDIEMNSCSTMHKIHEKEFTMEDFSHEHLTGETDGLWVNADRKDFMCSAWDFCQITCDVLNHYRELYLETKDKKYWWQMIQLLPSSYNQKRTVKLNYEVLANMYEFRHNHKLDEWVELMQFFKDNCPCSEVFTTSPNVAHIEARNELVKKLCNDIYNRLEFCQSTNLLGEIVISPEELKTLLSAAAKNYIYEKE